MRIQPDFLRKAAGSCLMEMGDTRVICTASIVAGVPPWRVSETDPVGWVTAEYGMLPASTGARKPRPLLKHDSRSVEIQRLIGRCLRTVVDFRRLGTNTIHLDCDVLEADGGTRTAAITGSYVALARAVRWGEQKGLFQTDALTATVAAVSVGIVDGRAVLDLDYAEDSQADVDMNVAMTGDGKFVEIQGTSEAAPFDSAQLEEMLTHAGRGVRELMQYQREAIER